MSERKVINKYFPPDFDPSKIKRRKLGKDPQQPVRLMAPFSMRCTRCGEYIYKGKKFNARKETASGEEYYGIKLFRFYIKCPVCSSEITFKTDPKNADYTMEHGANRNFENWSEADPGGKRTYMPDAAEDDDYDSDGNPLENKKEKDAMADLERSQEQSRREMEMMDELADLRQRNARLEQSNANADPESLLAALHAERQTAEEEARRKADQEEDDVLVAKYFSKVQSTKPKPPSGTIPTDGPRLDKGKGKAMATDEGEANGKGTNGRANGDNENESGDESGSESDTELPTLIIKRRPAPGVNGNGTAEPTVSSLLAARGKVLEKGNGTAPAGGTSNGAGNNAGQVKRKREGMQKLLGIKKKGM